MSHATLRASLAQIQGWLNQRPLTTYHDDMNSDPERILTPSNLVFGTFTSAGEFNLQKFADTDEIRKRWSVREKCLSLFKSIFFNQYIDELAPRKFWQKRLEKLKVGQICLLADAAYKRQYQWPLVKIVSLPQEGDKLSRTAEVRLRCNKKLPLVKDPQQPGKLKFRDQDKKVDGIQINTFFQPLADRIVRKNLHQLVPLEVDNSVPFEEQLVQMAKVLPFINPNTYPGYHYSYLDHDIPFPS